MDSKEHKDKLRQTVLEYMEPSFRFHLSLHLPALRSVEKRTPLNIKYLHLTDNAIYMNKAKFEIKIDRKYEIEEPPFRRNWPVDYDVDAFGFQTNTKCIMMKGDVCMENNSAMCMETSERLMEAMKGKEPSECRYTLKLKYVTEHRMPSDYRSSRITKIYEGMKVLIGSIFGNRTAVWNVDTMIISTGNVRWIWREYGEKPLVRNIKLRRYQSVNLDGLKLICHEASFPLKMLNFEMDTTILDHETVANAEYLIVRLEWFREDANSLNLLMKISNQKIQVNRISLNTVASLTGFWLKHGRPVGTSWSFEVQLAAREEPSRFIKNLKRNARAIASGRGSIEMSMGPYSFLSISYDNQILYDPVNQQDIWMVKMEVLHR
ncbi:hypothetical protein B9Z55_000162 [Caenorhabditis nigoni]|uniref:F-box associated domain-containing protein n=1 Tax=Caenorhabditis nigoni TaxID=1611254 RepID=A0A2G5VGW8_9PELO|nr:hypothetical protein B9Z55_000162 [Caenorhabditis nigoni]